MIAAILRLTNEDTTVIRAEAEAAAMQLLVVTPSLGIHRCLEISGRSGQDNLHPNIRNGALSFLEAVESTERSIVEQHGPFSLTRQ